MTDYMPIKALIMTARLKNEPVSFGATMAEKFPCIYCGAPAGYACGPGNQPWCRGVRSFREDDVATMKTARNLLRNRQTGERKTSGVRDEIYQGWPLSGGGFAGTSGPRSEIRQALAKMSPEELAVLEAMTAPVGPLRK